MTTNGMPPQAYTKETLSDAYEWIKHQSADVRRAATNSDTLVGLYLNAQRRKLDGFDSFYEKPHSFHSSDSAPVSGEAFKKELKSLAIGLNEFVEKSEVHRTTSRPSPSHVQNVMRHHHEPVSRPVQEPPHEAPVQQQPSFSFGQSELPNPPVETRSRPSTTSAADSPFDGVTQQRIDQVKKALNLSSDTEVLRMLVSLGFEKIKTILPPT